MDDYWDQWFENWREICRITDAAQQAARSAPLFTGVPAAPFVGGPRWT